MEAKIPWFTFPDSWVLSLKFLWFNIGVADIKVNLAKSGIIRFGVESGMIRIRNSSAPDFFPRDSSDIKQK